MKKLILDKWNIAKARVRSGEGRAVHLVLGDSMTMGTGAGSGGSGNHIDAYPHSYPNDLATLMREKLLLTVNNNWLGDQGINAATSGSVTPAQYDPRIALGPQWGFGPDEILAGRFIVFNPGGGTDVCRLLPKGSSTISKLPIRNSA